MTAAHEANHSNLLILGAGPAGISGALAARAAGLDVTVLDEARSGGGQVYRKPSADGAAAALDKGNETGDRGDALRASLAASGARILFERRVWNLSVEGAGFRIDAVCGDRVETWTADALLCASGAQERAIPVPGWTLPGVFGLAATTVLLKTHAGAPGKRTLVAGSGPLLYAVAAGILDAGGEVAAVVDIAPFREWAGNGLRFIDAPKLSLRGAGWISRLRLRRIPIHFGHAVCAFEGEDAVRGAIVRAFDKKTGPSGPKIRIEADAVAIGYGLTPTSEATSILGAEHVHSPGRGGWIPVHDESGRTSIPRLYVAGDCAGITGAVAAEVSGTAAGRAAAEDLGRAPPPARHVAGTRKIRFGAAMARMMEPPISAYTLTTPETIVCRCEDVTRAEIETALDEGAETLNEIKTWTRCGMGPCQGRVCGEAAAAIFASRRGCAVGDLQRWTVRAPIRPVPVHALTGDFSYADVLAVIPEPAAS